MGPVSSSTNGGEQQGKPPSKQDTEFWSYSPVELFQRPGPARPTLSAAAPRSPGAAGT